MKKLETVLTVFASVGFFSAAQAAESCAAKSAALEKEIRIAEQFGNSYKIASLKKALAEIKAHCTNASVLADAQKDVAKLEKKVAEKQADLRELQQKLS